MRGIRQTTQRISAARQAAFDTLQQVASGAYASDTLRETTRLLSSRDAALASQIVFGSLRFQAQLDYLILHYSRRDARELDDAVRLALRIAIYQLRYLERIPPHAAVHESVEYVKLHKRAASGFTNAVLRKVNRKPMCWPDLATELSTPGWLLERWSDHFGDKTAQSIALASLQEPIPYVRLPLGGPPTSPQLELEATSLSGAYRVRSSLPPDLRLHDIGSQSIVPLLELEPADRYLDLCAAPGNKTIQALETPLALAIACDISLNRLQTVPPVCPRVLLDATQPLPFAEPFRKIFIDAPCSGTGTLGRNPEIKWRITSQDFARFHQKQRAILTEAVRLLSSGGRLLYATCSLEAEENESVVRAILESNAALRLAHEKWRLPGKDEGDGFYAALLERPE